MRKVQDRHLDQTDRTSSPVSQADLNVGMCTVREDLPTASSRRTGKSPIINTSGKTCAASGRVGGYRCEPSAGWRWSCCSGALGKSKHKVHCPRHWPAVQLLRNNRQIFPRFLPARTKARVRGYVPGQSNGPERYQVVKDHRCLGAGGL